jgi:RNA polymerase sigma-70 factor (ECF subfamily)
MEGVLLASRDKLGQAAIARAAAGDRVAFTALVAAHHADLLRICYLILGDVSQAEDAAQSAWVKAWRKLGQLREPAKLRSWLVAVAANEARQLARRRRGYPMSLGVEPYGAEADPALADLSAALATLTADERRLIGLRYVLEMTSDEIGAALGISAGAVRHRLMRLVSRLRTELDR